MSGYRFTPRTHQPIEDELNNEGSVLKNDSLSSSLWCIVQYAVVLMVGGTVIFFNPGLWASLGFDKTLFTLVLATTAVIAGSLQALRREQVKTLLPISLLIFWLFVLMALVSGLLSGDTQDALRGNVFETQTVGFLAVLAVAITLPLSLQGSRIMSIKALALFGLTAVLVLLYNIIRLFFGADVLALGSFNVATISPIGSFNDLAIFAALTIILTLITLAQLPLRMWLQLLLLVTVVMALLVLAVVNFFNIWIVVGFFGLLMLVYLLSRDMIFQNVSSYTLSGSKLLIIPTALVCVVSVLFIVAGDYAGNKVNEVVSVNYVEVRPSLTATIGIAKAVYTEDILFGIGPNRFADAWRLHKDRSINETVFWDTDFNSGNGFVPTVFVNTGLLGGLLLVLFHISFLYLGYRMLLRSNQQDPYWYYFGVTTFAAAVFIWVISYVYVPGTAILLLGALFTGLSYVAASALLPEQVKTIPLVVNRRRGFFLMAAIIFVITVTVGSLFTVGKQYVAQSQFTKMQATAESVAAFERTALSSYSLYKDDRFVSARAQIQLANLASLLAIAEPTEEDQQNFLSTSEQALLFAEQAVTEDATNPDNHAILSGVYSNLAQAGISGATERADSALAEARRLDPLNPGYDLIAAQMAARVGDIEKARAEIRSALNLKRNFTQALYLLAQLDISEGNTDAAIATTRSIIQLEPNNPTRYFQLGILLSAQSNFREAAAAYQMAIKRDPQYANARYLLALTYLDLEQPELALEQLRVVQATNQENEQLRTLIQQIESGTFTGTPALGLDTTPVSEVSPQEASVDTVVTDSAVDTDLVVPVNTVSGTEEDVSFSELLEENTEETETQSDSIE